MQRKMTIQWTLACFGISLIMGAGVLIRPHMEANPAYLRMKQEKALEEAREIKGAVNYYKQLTANQVTGEVDFRDVQAARAKAEAMSDGSFKKTRAFTNMKWSETGPNNVGGRSRVVLVDKNNTNKLYMGGVGGGFWISNDNGNSWTKRGGNDTSSAIAVASIAQAANGDIYYGTGEGQSGWAGASWVAQLFQIGEGIFKSTDGGVTFTQLTATIPGNSNSPNDAWAYVNKIAAHPTDPGKLFAATYGGLKMTTNGGTSWAKPTGLSTSSHFFDVEVSSDGNKVVACTNSALYISNDGGSTFSANLMGANGLPASSTAGRVEAAISPSDPNYVYIAVAATNESLKGIYKSTDGGQTWTTIGLGGSAVFNPLGNQGVYDLAFGVHPTNKEMVFLGGQLELVRYTPASGWKTIAYWLAFGGMSSMVHADMHCIAFNPSNPENMYVTTDGGFYRTFNCSDVSPDFAEKNKNYAVTQCYGLAANYLGRVIFGSQDNGSGLMGESANSLLESRDIGGGDGTRCAMSDYFPNFIFMSIVEGELRRAADGAQSSSSFKSFFDKNVDLNAGGSGSNPDGAPDEGALWVAPIHYKEKKVGSTVKTVFLFGTNSSVWMTQEALKGNPVWFRLYSPGAVGFSALTMAPDGKTVFAATQGGNVLRIRVPSLWDSTYRYADTISNMPTGSPYNYPLYSSCQTSSIASFPGRFVTDLSCDASGNTVIVTLANYSNSSYVFKLSNAVDSTSPTATDITANLPKMPVYTSLCLYGSSTKFMIGTDLGVWGTDNGGTSWVELNKMNADETTWHPRVATYELAEKDTYVDGKGGAFNGSIVYSGTHGRGTFRSTSLSDYIMPAPTDVSSVDRNAKSITVYPNPARSNATIEYMAEQSSSATVRIFTLTGTAVQTRTVQITQGKNLIPVDVSNLAKGGYIIYLNDHGHKAGSTLIVE